MERNNPLISVVTVSYNAVSVIEQTIFSVINQTYPNVEYIIIDGGSTDGTVDIIKKYADKITYWVSEPDKGIYDAMNKGIELATGEWINFMNAGDSFYSFSILELIFGQTIFSNDIIYGDTLFLAPNLEYVRKTLPLDTISRCMPFGHQSTFVKTLLMKEQKFDVSFISRGDYNFFYQMYYANKSFCHIKQIIARYDNTKGISVENYRVVLRENARIWGIENSIQWKCKYWVIVCMRDLKRAIRRMIPTKILFLRQRLIIRSKYQKNETD